MSSKGIVFKAMDHVAPHYYFPDPESLAEDPKPYDATTPVKLFLGVSKSFSNSSLVPNYFSDRNILCDEDESLLVFMAENCSDTLFTTLQFLHCLILGSCKIDSVGRILHNLVDRTKYFEKSLQRMHIDNSSLMKTVTIDHSIIEQLLPRCLNLQHLYLHRTEINERTFESLLPLAPSLRRLQSGIVNDAILLLIAKHFVQMEVLMLNACQVTVAGVSAALAEPNLPRLQALRVPDGFRSATSPTSKSAVNDLITKLITNRSKSLTNFLCARHLEYDALTILPLLKTASSLSILELSDGANITDEFLKGLACPTTSEVSCLTTMKFTRCSGEELTSAGFTIIFQRFVFTLEVLEIDFCPAVDDSCFEPFSNSLRRLPLVEVELKDCDNITPQAFVNMSRLELEHIVLEGCSEIDNTFFKVLATSPSISGSLKTLILKDNESVTGEALCRHFATTSSGVFNRVMKCLVEVEIYDCPEICGWEHAKFLRQVYDPIYLDMERPNPFTEMDDCYYYDSDNDDYY